MTLMNLCDGTRLTAHYDQVEEVHSMESSSPISVLPIGPPVILWHQATPVGEVADRITEQVACALIERSWPSRCANSNWANDRLNTLLSPA